MAAAYSVVQTVQFALNNHVHYVKLAIIYNLVNAKLTVKLVIMEIQQHSQEELVKNVHQTANNVKV